MNINRRKFFRFVGLGVAAAAIPSFLKGEEQPKKQRNGLYGWSEQGFAVIDNRRILSGEMDDHNIGMWNIKEGKDYNKYEVKYLLDLEEGRLNRNDDCFSKEALEDIRKWGIEQVDEKTMREIYCLGKSGLSPSFPNINYYTVYNSNTSGG